MSAKESVVLVNGLWLGDPALWLLAWRLRHAGFRVHMFSYPSVRHDLHTNAARLHDFLARVPGETVHLVGYSLGGLIVRTLFHLYPQQRPGRIVLLGSPQTGNRAAQSMMRSRIGRWLLGRSVADLVAGLPQCWSWPARATGVIAGSRSVGLGALGRAAGGAERRQRGGGGDAGARPARPLGAAGGALRHAGGASGGTAGGPVSA